VLGILVGGGLIYMVVRLGKLLFGRRTVALPAGSKIIFTDTALMVGEEETPYGELLYRQSDTIKLHARTLELVDRCYREVDVRLSRTRLRIGSEEFDPESVPYMEAVSEEIVLPREAMGLGDVKFMAAIGAFLGWKAVFFSLMASSLIGSVAGLTLILFGKQEWSARLPYGPYIALAAAIWVFAGRQIVGLLGW
jgi:leader peptidase (prepilin peptidase)/N-methyltransferase